MFGLPILDIAIGLSFIYLILALTCTAINELIAGWMNRRTENLYIGITNLLNDSKLVVSSAGAIVDATGGTKGQTLVDSLYSHPLIKALKEKGTKPSYIPSPTFAAALLDLVAPADPTGSRTIKDVREKLGQLPADSDLRRSLLVIVDDAGDDLKKVQANIETWFNNSMDRVSAWYKTRTQTIVWIIAIVVVLATNADTLRIGRTLSNDNATRDVLVAQAQAYVNNNPRPGTPDPTKPLADTKKELEKNVIAIQALGVPLGYKGDGPLGLNWQDAFNWWLSKIFGLLLTIGAASLGAPFWFDMLNKVVNIRSAGKSPDEKAKSEKADQK